MEYTVITVIVVLVGLIVTVTTPIVKLTSAITKLKAIIDEFTRRIDRIENANSESHRRIWVKNDEQDKTLNEHEHRIGILEHTDQQRK